MRRADAVKSIFWELRASGIAGSARDILRLAHFLLKSHTGEVGKVTDFGRVVDSRALPLVPVDFAINHGAWKILEFENSRNNFQDSDGYESHEALRRLERVIGPLWAHSLPRD